jgi:hypothetical protein
MYVYFSVFTCVSRRFCVSSGGRLSYVEGQRSRRKYESLLTAQWAPRSVTGIIFIFEVLGSKFLQSWLSSLLSYLMWCRLLLGYSALFFLVIVPFPYLILCRLLLGYGAVSFFVMVETWLRI